MSLLAGINEHRIDGRRAWASAIILAALQSAILLYMVVTHALVLAHGTEVLLKAAPVDPRDLLRGEYVTLSYDISTVPKSTLTGKKPDADTRAPLFVRLQKQADGYWGVSESSFEQLPEKDGSVVLKSQPANYYVGPNDMRVAYGIESYYVPEGEGRHLEEANSEHRLSIAARVGANGQAQIRSLLLDGQPVYDEPPY